MAKNVKPVTLSPADMIAQIKAQAEEAVKALRDQIGDKEQSINDLAEEIADLMNQVSALRDQRSKLESEIAPIRAQIREFEQVLNPAAPTQANRPGRKPSPVEVPAWLSDNVKVGDTFGGQDMVTWSGLSRATVQNLITKLVDAGLASKQGHGVYVLA